MGIRGRIAHSTLADANENRDWRIYANSPKSWSVDAMTIDQTTFDLSVKNPNGGEEVIHRSPKAIMKEIALLDRESAEVLEKIKKLMK